MLASLPPQEDLPPPLTARLATTKSEQHELSRVIGSVVGIEGTLTLNDVETIIPLRVKISRPDDSRIVVASTQPIAINVAAFGFEKGVDKLRELAALASIDTTVPVSFSLTYNSFRL